MQQPRVREVSSGRYLAEYWSHLYQEWLVLGSESSSIEQACEQAARWLRLVNQVSS